MIPSQFHRGLPQGRGFTLVELLVVLTIIGMLASIVAATVYAADQRSREAATKATIAKLHAIVMQIYDSYRTRRVPVDVTGLNPQAAAVKKLQALRDIMRMEMPERKSDLVALVNSNWVRRGPVNFPWGSVPEPSVYVSYVPTAADATMIGTRMDLDADHANGPAECLYMIVCKLGGEDARRQFRDAEVGDTDGNGLPEFLDGWGRPIFFMRWAPGFNLSDLQPNVPPTTAADAARDDHDPFDTRKVDASAWRLAPLIYSAGRDGKFGIFEDAGGSAYVWQNNTYTQINGQYLGAPLTGVSTCADNLHNHSIEASE